MHASRDVVCFTMMISGNNIGSEGAKALAPSLGRLTQLTTLNLTGEYSIMGVTRVVVGVWGRCWGCGEGGAQGDGGGKVRGERGGERGEEMGVAP